MIERWDVLPSSDEKFAFDRFVGANLIGPLATPGFAHFFAGARAPRKTANIAHRSPSLFRRVDAEHAKALSRWCVARTVSTTNEVASPSWARQSRRRRARPPVSAEMFPGLAASHVVSPRFSRRRTTAARRGEDATRRNRAAMASVCRSDVRTSLRRTAARSYARVSRVVRRQAQIRVWLCFLRLAWAIF